PESYCVVTVFQDLSHLLCKLGCLGWLHWHCKLGTLVQCCTGFLEFHFQQFQVLLFQHLCIKFVLLEFKLRAGHTWGHKGHTDTNTAKPQWWLLWCDTIGGCCVLLTLKQGDLPRL